MKIDIVPRELVSDSAAELKPVPVISETTTISLKEIFIKFLELKVIKIVQLQPTLFVPTFS